MSLLLACAVGAGGGIGALARAAAGRLIKSSFPFATLLVNITGSFILAAAMAGLPAESEFSRAFIGSGFCGALTTFSTFILETVILYRSGQKVRAGLYLLLTLLLCSLASLAGFCLIK